MPSYKLTYFNSKARVELIRFIFAQAEVPYEDKRVTSAEWQEVKPSTPYGTLPVLEVDGKQLAGTVPIARFLAERFGLAGTNDLENAEIAGIDDVITDLLHMTIKVFQEKDETRKADLKKALGETHVPRYLGVLEKRAKNSGTPEGWLWGKLTWPDFDLYMILDFVEMYIPDVTKNYPTLATLRTSVETLPNIVKWIKERPQTEF